MKLGRSLTWDAEKQQVVGDDEANKLLRRPYRGTVGASGGLMAFSRELLRALVPALAEARG